MKEINIVYEEDINEKNKQPVEPYIIISDIDLDKPDFPNGFSRSTLQYNSFGIQCQDAEVQIKTEKLIKNKIQEHEDKIKEHTLFINNMKNLLSKVI